MNQRFTGDVDVSSIYIDGKDPKLFDKIYDFMLHAKQRGDDVHIECKEGKITIDNEALDDVMDWFLEGHMQERVDKINSGEITIDMRTNDVREKVFKKWETKI